MNSDIQAPSIPSLLRALDESDASLFSVNRLLGFQVRNSNDQKVGKVEDVILNPETGALSYVIVRTGGLLGFGKKCFVVSWTALSLDRRSNRFVLYGDLTR